MVIAASHARRRAELLDAARAGDEDAFAQIVEEYRAEVHAHCYRMLGSLHDAEDAVQETFLRAWRGLGRFAGRSALRTWLYRIATNACLDVIARRPRGRLLPIDDGPPSTSRADLGQPVVESVWVEPYPDEALGVVDGYAAPEARYEQREAVELAFIAALQHLPARQRAVLIMRDVLGFSAREASESLETSVASVNSALQRARKAVDERLPDRSQQATLRSLGDERVSELVQAYIEAWARRDVATVAALLVEDAVFSMPPWSSWWRGREMIAGFAGDESCAAARMVATRASGQPAIASYAVDAKTGRFVATAIDVLTLEGGLIREMTAFVAPEMFPRFNLPQELSP
jgi:RNA polymerase sigma-70 factor, ECF subfamily